MERITKEMGIGLDIVQSRLSVIIKYNETPNYIEVTGLENGNKVTYHVHDDGSIVLS